MPIQNATEPELSKTGESQPRKSPWVRLFLYLLLIGAGAFIGWRVYQNKQKTAANTQSSTEAQTGAAATAIFQVTASSSRSPTHRRL